MEDGPKLTSIAPVAQPAAFSLLRWTGQEAVLPRPLPRRFRAQPPTKRAPPLLTDRVAGIGPSTPARFKRAPRGSQGAPPSPNQLCGWSRSSASRKRRGTGRGKQDDCDALRIPTGTFHDPLLTKAARWRKKEGKRAGARYDGKFRP